MRRLVYNRTTWAPLALCLLSFWSRSVWALSDSDKEAVRTLSNQAAEEFKQNQFEAARAKFTSAYRIASVPRLAVWAARANERLGHLVAAYEMYRQALRLRPNDLWQGDLQPQAQRDAQQELDALLVRIPKITIAIEGEMTESTAVTIDDVTVPNALIGLERLIDPGQHKIQAKRGAEIATESLQIAERDNKHVVLRFNAGSSPAVGAMAPTPPMNDGSAPNQPQQAPASSYAAQPVPVAISDRNHDMRFAGWTGVGIGAVGLTLGTITGIYVAAKHGYLDDPSRCPTKSTCDPAYQSDVSTYNTMRTVSTVGFVVGGIGAAAGVTLLLTTSKPESKGQVSLKVSPEMVTVGSSF